jgi:Flp pilus assembly protein CpaB
MKPKTMILMVVAVVCGLGASYMTSRLLAERDEKPPEPPPPEKVTILVAKTKLPMHMAVGNDPEKYFAEKTLVKDGVPEGALTKEDLPKLKKKWLKRSMVKDGHITLADLMDSNQGLSQLPNGMRALGIRVNPETIAGGFASLPGSHVDIIWTGRENGNGAIKSIRLLEDVIVLAADSQDAAGETKAMVASVVTVALSPDDALKITEALATGELRLVLRNFEDRTTAKDVAKAPAEVDPPQPPREVVKGDRDRRDVKPAEDPKVADQQPPGAQKKSLPPGVRKIAVTQSNGQESKTYHYWVDARNNIISNPELQGLEDDDPAPTPAPAPGPDGKVK